MASSDMRKLTMEVLHAIGEESWQEGGLRVDRMETKPVDNMVKTGGLPGDAWVGYTPNHGMPKEMVTLHGTVHTSSYGEVRFTVTTHAELE